MLITPIRRIVIVGGGTAGWMTAAALSKVLSPQGPGPLPGGAYQVQLVESDEIGSIGVGEATIPNIKNFNTALEIDEDEFLRATQGTFKLGIEFVDWGGLGDRYIHGFGKIGQELDGVPFHHYWWRMAQEGAARELAHYSINTAAPLQAKFMRGRPDMPGSPLADIANAFHFDAGLYARYLRSYAEKRGVVRHEGRIVQVLQREPDGFITGVQLADGRVVEGDFFVDCSGIRGLLIEQTLQAGYDDWNHWLPCNRAVAVPCESHGPLLPITRATARTAGWQWRIPLQHRIGNGHVYSSHFMSDQQAIDLLMANLDGKPLAEPRVIPFVPGRRRKVWDRNCVAIGLSAGFFEPIESTNIHLIQTAVSRLVSLFPHAGLDEADIAEFNAQVTREYARIRDFVILHYKATERTDSPFWRHCGAMSVPQTLQHKMDLFRSNGRIYREDDELFGELSWSQVMFGQRMRPRGYHPLVDVHPRETVLEFLGDVERVIAKCVSVMPSHQDFIAQCCAVKAP